MQLTPFCLTLTCLRVSPDKSQFFRYDPISLSCDDQMNSSGWKVKGKTLEGVVRPCSSNWSSTSSGSTCTISNSYPTDSGLYWCESANEETSNGVNITITDRDVILESPALPVADGSTVILRCKAETYNPDHRFDFYKDGRSISNSSSTGEMTIRGASKTDEGLYKCSIAGRGESVASWLAVEAPSAAPSSVSVSRVMCHLVVGTPYLLSTILLGLIYRERQRAQMVAERRGDDDVIMEIVV